MAESKLQKVFYSDAPWYPNGADLLYVAAGIYRTSPSNIPSQGLPGNTYGALLVLGNANGSTYRLIFYVGVNGNSGVFACGGGSWKTITSA